MALNRFATLSEVPAADALPVAVYARDQFGGDGPGHYPPFLVERGNYEFRANGGTTSLYRLPSIRTLRTELVEQYLDDLAHDGEVSRDTLDHFLELLPSGDTVEGRMQAQYSRFDELHGAFGSALNDEGFWSKVEEWY